MNGDRTPHPHVPFHGLCKEAAGARQPLREPAASHFRRLGEPALERRESRTVTAGALDRFEVYRTDEVPTSSTRFAGGDWHWRLCDGAGRTLVDAGGYRDEAACREAVAILRERAANAAVVPRP